MAVTAKSTATVIDLADFLALLIWLLLLCLLALVLVSSD